MIELSKRDVLGGSLAALWAGSRGAAAAAATAPVAIRPGRFDASVASLQAYRAPEWFRNAKFGIWAHWGPQAVPAQGDWYARWMYVPGHPCYDHHVKTYGHPSEKGYKDIIPLWTAARWDPDALAARYAAAGARYLVSMGVHHDNFDLWRSRHQRWNATRMGPKRDVVGEWQAAAKRHGMRFGVSEHLGASYTWWYPNHLYDQFWPRLGVEYDGADPRYADLYHDNRTEPFTNKPGTWYTKNPAYHRHWFDRISDLLDSYQPDFLYTDGGIPFGEVGRALMAHFYNSRTGPSGQVEAVYACKNQGSGDFFEGTAVQDVERGVLKGINPLPWQTDSSNGDWFHKTDDSWKSSAEVLAILTDVVSKNGNLLLNIVLRADGSLPPESDRLLADLEGWFQVNAEAIHDTRPWKIFGEGPTEAAGGAFGENGRYTARDIRFTTKGERLFALTLAPPAGPVAITTLRRGSRVEPRRVGSVHLLGRGPVAFRQTASALVVDLPASLPTPQGVALDIRFA
ncbi:alpha-L-fucosidase [Sphingomonas metalli]|uniref:alpha-L-fucosidase n=1 Tax=Sphingomonas metalli TaxID=1779358 RepID=A0A916TE47_9SPHN|nr:alpha-L-fucosidase [Sphingomonas metalli]GGB41592.1 alpha-L-fucosidase [Sphingomonas metalli]